MPGVLLAVKQIADHPGVTVGLDPPPRALTPTAGFSRLDRQTSGAAESGPAGGVDGHAVPLGPVEPELHALGDLGVAALSRSHGPGSRSALLSSTIAATSRRTTVGSPEQLERLEVGLALVAA